MRATPTVLHVRQCLLKLDDCHVTGSREEPRGPRRRLHQRRHLRRRSGVPRRTRRSNTLRAHLRRRKTGLIFSSLVGLVNFIETSKHSLKTTATQRMPVDAIRGMWLVEIFF